jgi:hypothetical protein
MRVRRKNMKYLSILALGVLVLAAPAGRPAYASEKPAAEKPAEADPCAAYKGQPTYASCKDRLFKSQRMSASGAIDDAEAKYAAGRYDAAMEALAPLIKEGNGVAKAKQQELASQRLAALTEKVSQGDCRAEQLTGSFYYTDLGGRKNLEEAAYWYGLSASCIAAAADKAAANAVITAPNGQKAPARQTLAGNALLWATFMADAMKSLTPEQVQAVQARLKAAPPPSGEMPLNALFEN